MTKRRPPPATTFAANVDEARAATAVLTAPTFANCFSKLPPVTAGEETVGYRTAGRGRANGRTVTLTLDFTFFRVARAVGMVLGSGINSTVPEAERTGSSRPSPGAWPRSRPARGLVDGLWARSHH